MNKHVKKLISFVTRKHSSTFEYSRDPPPDTATPTDLCDVTTQYGNPESNNSNDYNRSSSSSASTSTNIQSEVILNPSRLPNIMGNDKSSVRTSGVNNGGIEEGQLDTTSRTLMTKSFNHESQISSMSSVVSSSPSSPPSYSVCDVTTGSGSTRCSNSGGAGKPGKDSTSLNAKDFQVFSFDDETPRLSDEVELTDDQKAELKQAFSMFEKTGKGRIQARDLGELLRCLGWNPSEQDLEEARHELELSTRGTISFSEVEAYIARRGGIYYGNNAEEDIMVAFQVLDKTGSGKITVSDFRHFMTTMGERMSHEEVEELIECSTRGGKDYIEYRDLVHAVQQSPT